MFQYRTSKETIVSLFVSTCRVLGTSCKLSPSLCLSLSISMFVPDPLFVFFPLIHSHLLSQYHTPIKYIYMIHVYLLPIIHTLTLFLQWILIGANDIVNIVPYIFFTSKYYLLNVNLFDPYIYIYIYLMRAIPLSLSHV